jgi:hypothetical protein
MQLTARRLLLAAVPLAFLGHTALADDARPQASSPPPAPLTPPAATESPPHVSSLAGRISTDVAGYGDSDHVFVFTPEIAGRLENPTAGWSVDASYLVDVVSAASVDIVSTASKNYTEIRQAGSLAGAYKPRDLGFALNAGISREPDYLSLDAGGSVSYDLLDKNLTLFLGFNHVYDLAGRTDTPSSVFSRTLNVEGAKAGVTFVMDRRTIASVVADAIYEDGDPSKPYRYVPLFAPGTNVPNGASVSEVNSLRLSVRPLEQLPLSRQRYAGSFRLAHRFHNKTTLRLDERLYDDSWALKATTTDLRYLIDVGSRFEIGPHFRFHAQSEASFWQRAYTLGPNFAIPAIRTGNRELGPLLGTTAGFSVRWKLGPPEDRTKWLLGWDANVTETHFLDDIYITDRLAWITGLLFEVGL